MKKKKNLPARGNKHNNGDDDGATDGGTGGDRNLVHVTGIREHSPHLSALMVVDILRRHIDVLQGDHADNDALLRGNVLDLELAFTGFQRRSLLEALVPEQAIDDTEAKDVGGVRVPLDDDGTVLAEGVLYLHFVGSV